MAPPHGFDLTDPSSRKLDDLPLADKPGGGVDSKRKFLVGGLVAGGLLLLYGMGFIHWMELKSEESRLKKEVVHLQIENRRLFEEARRLREDPAYAEAVARQQLGFTRPGETIVKFTDRDRKQSSNR